MYACVCGAGTGSEWACWSGGLRPPGRGRRPGPARPLPVCDGGSTRRAVTRCDGVTVPRAARPESRHTSLGRRAGPASGPHRAGCAELDRRAGPQSWTGEPTAQSWTAELDWRADRAELAAQSWDDRAGRAELGRPYGAERAEGPVLCAV